MILILRGHIRDSFDNNNLYELIKSIYEKNGDLMIYIHTWSIFQNNLSWRKMDNIFIEVTEKKNK
jgi:hypothetical protein